MSHILDNQLGYYSVGQMGFLNKYQALLSGTTTKQEVGYHWFDDEFKNFDRSRLGKTPLNEMYKRRAQQIRDSYDYVILNYSGGCDSWNILKTFLDNNIKLDQIMVCWPFTAAEAKTYNANSKDTTAFNFMSEWDFTTKPDLEWLSRTHPEIKIELIDWADPFVKDTNFVGVDKFDQLNHFHNLADLARSTLFSETEKQLIDKGKKVATIWGIDKPNVHIDTVTKQLSMAFADSVITVGHPPVYNPTGTEYFYWCPSMPELTFEMAYQTALWFRARPEYQQFIYPLDNTSYTFPYITHVQVNQMAARDACYTTWAEKENKFQVNKSTFITREDKDFWLYNTSELTHHVKNWKGIFQDHAKVLDTNLVAFNDKFQRAGYKPINTMMHYICDL
jgi:hypothetical protein